MPYNSAARQNSIATGTKQTRLFALNKVEARERANTILVIQRRGQQDTHFTGE